MVSESGGMMVALVVAVLMLETTKAAFIDKRPKMPRFPSFPSLSIKLRKELFTRVYIQQDRKLMEIFTQLDTIFFIEFTMAKACYFR